MELEVSYERKQKAAGRPNKAHPGIVCAKCAKCKTNSTSRWRHKSGYSQDYLLYIETNFGIKENDCLCNSCAIDLDKKYGIVDPPPEKKIKICSNSAILDSNFESFLKCLDLMPTNPTTNQSKNKEIGNVKQNTGKQDQLANLRCAIPSCKAKILKKSSQFVIPNFETLKNYYESNGDHVISNLSIDSKICNKCRLKLKKENTNIEVSNDINEEVLESTEPNISTLIYSFKQELKYHETFNSQDYERMALLNSYVFLLYSLLSNAPVFLSDLFSHFKTALSRYLVEKSAKSECYRSMIWFKMKMEEVFRDLVDFHVMKIKGSILKQKGTLLLKKNADLANLIHEMYFQKRTDVQNQETTDSEIETFDIKNNKSTAISDAYQVVIADLSRRYQSQAQSFKDTFLNSDLSKIDLNEISESIDPYLWNFHYLVSQTKNEWRKSKSFPTLEHNVLGNMSSHYFQTRVYRTLFSICHTLYQVSSGECSKPLHILLADMIDAYSGSTKLSSTLNSFGLVTSKYKLKDHMDKIVKKRSMSKFIDDLNVDSFTIVSIDNIDIGQPNASVKLGFQDRGIHATSYQAVQPKPLSLLYSSNTTVSSLSESLRPDFYQLTQLEETAMSVTSDQTFQYILQKKSIEDVDNFIPNLKCHLSQSHDPKTEKANVSYLGVLNERCDNAETIRHVVEKVHEIFDSAENKHMILVGDAKTYDLICKLKTEYSEELAWIIPFPGDWHILKNTQPVLFKIYFDAGLREIAKITHKEDGLLTILQQCTSFRKTHTFIMHVWECFYRAEIDSFIKYREQKSPQHCPFQTGEIMQKILEFTVDSKNYEKRFEKIKQLRSDLVNSLQIPDLKHEFDEFSSKMSRIDDTFKFWHDFVHKHAFSYIALYIAFRSSNWNLRMAALKKLCPLYHAYDRPMYLRLVPKHLSIISEMPVCILQHLENGGFSATKTGNSWQQLALDEAHESFINLDVKESVRTPSPELLDTMSTYLPYRASLQNNINSQLHPVSSNVTPLTNELYKSNMKQDEDICLEYLKKISESEVFNITTQNRGLLQLFTNKQAEGGLHYDLMNFYDVGQKSMEIYIKSRILQEPSVQTPVRKHTLKTFTQTAPKKKERKNTESQEKLLYNKCLKKEMAFSMRTGKPLKKFNRYISLPRAICNVDGAMNHQDTKSNAIRHLSTRYIDLTINKLPPSFKPDLVILEGMFMINSAPLKTHHKTFKDHLNYLARRWIIPHLRSGAKEVHLLFDRPGALSVEGNPSLKDLERIRRDVTKQPPPTYDNMQLTSELLKYKWCDFLRNRENKRNYIKLLSIHFLDLIKPFLSDQRCVLNGCFDDGNCFGISTGSEMFQLPDLNSNHEETDTLIWLHVLKSSHSNILIFSPDTDIPFIGLPYGNNAILNKETFIQMNTLGNNSKFLHLNKLVYSLDRDPDLGCMQNQQKLKCIQMLYICSGCDYISFFKGYGKAMFFSTLFQFSKFICCGLSNGQCLSSGILSETSEEGFLSFIRLIGCLYFKKNTSEFLPNYNCASDIFKDLEHNSSLSASKLHEEWLNIIRDKVQTRTSYEDEVPPSFTSLRYHWLRSCLVAKMYEQSSSNEINLPPYTEYGFEIVNSVITPIWDDKEHIARVENHVKWLLRGCKCKKGCLKNNCKCRKGKRLCGPGCVCLNCQNCNSTSNICTEIEIEESEIVSSKHLDSESDDEYLTFDFDSTFG